MYLWQAKHKARVQRSERMINWSERSGFLEHSCPRLHIYIYIFIIINFEPVHNVKIKSAFPVCFFLNVLFFMLVLHELMIFIAMHWDEV